MKTNKGMPEVSELRLRAEKEPETAAGNTETSPEMSPEKMKALMHELEVHQIELQMQNDELRRIQGYSSRKVKYGKTQSKKTSHQVAFPVANMIQLLNKHHI